MKPMKNLLIVVVLMIASPVLAQTELNVVTADSKVVWTGTKVVGYRQGTMKLKEGKVKIANNKLVDGYFIIDMNSINCTDIPEEDAEPKQKLESHLKGPDFFDVKKFPTARFDIDEVRAHPDNPARYLIVGDLTIKGITKRWKLEAEPTTQTDKLFISQASLRFDRQQFGVAYKGIKDELVHDIVRLDIIIKAK
jgi:polyisoprenoid-binding protein YceI